MSDVWGKGGLFEQALASKMERQASETALNRSNVGVNMMNAQTNRLEADNKYDLGLRANAVSRGQLDVQRGALGVDRFNADTTRLNTALNMRGPIDTARASNLGLTTFNPTATPAAPSALSTPSAPSASPMFSTSTGSSTKPNSFSDRPMGMRNGGLALKPKMVKQPGYMHGGKITMPKGYKAGGKIGDVKHDKGHDTVDVKARPGEYFLNPETVAHVGGGDYSEGVRNLDALVREATGKEPGPIPVGKGGKQGFAWSGPVVDDFGNRLPGREVPVTDDYGNRQATSRTGQIMQERAARAAARVVPPTEVIAVDRAGGAGTPEQRVIMENARAQQAAAQANMPRGERAAAAGARAGQAVRGAVDTVKAAMPSIRSAAGMAVAPAAATLETGLNISDKSDFYDSPDVPTLEKVKQGLRDMAKPIATWAGGTVGAGAGTVASPSLVVNPVTAGLAGAAGARALVGSVVDDEGEAYKRFRAANPKYVAAPAAPAEKPAEAPAAAPRDFDKEVRDKLAESEAKAAAEKAKAKDPSMREFYLAKLDELKADDSRLGIFNSNQRNALERDLIKSLGDLEEKQMGAKSAAAKALLDQRNKNSDDLEKMLKERFTKSFADPKTGEVKESYNQAEANEFRRHIVDQITKATQNKDSPFYGMDIRDINPYQIMASAPDFQTRQGVRNMVNREIGSMKDGAISSELLKGGEIVGADELRFGKDVGPFTSAESSAQFLRDYLPSLWKNRDYDRVVVVRRGDKTHRIPMTQFTRTAEGDINEDVLNQYPSLRELMRSK